MINKLLFIGYKRYFNTSSSKEQILISKFFVPTDNLSSNKLMSVQFISFSGLMSLLGGLYGLIKWYSAGYTEFASWGLVLVLGMPAVLVLTKYEVLPKSLTENCDRHEGKLN